MVAADPAVVLFATALATALVGVAVAGLAYQGYRRHDSQAMRFLAYGLLLITVSPFLVSYGIAPALALPEVMSLLTILVANILGLLAILYSLEGT